MDNCQCCWERKLGGETPPLQPCGKLLGGETPPLPPFGSAQPNKVGARFPDPSVGARFPDPSVGTRFPDPSVGTTPQIHTCGAQPFTAQPVTKGNKPGEILNIPRKTTSKSIGKSERSPPHPLDQLESSNTKKSLKPLNGS